MSEHWNVEAVVDSKPEPPPATPPEKPSEDAAPAIPPVLSNDHSLGEIMTLAREARGFSREQAATTSNIPGYYLTMIETDDYSSIADQLYLLPFLRRYAVFVTLEPEEVASRFIRDVQRADMNPGRVSEPIAMFEPRKPLPWRIIMTVAAALVVIGAWYGYRHLVARKSALANSKPSAAAEQVIPEAEPAVPKTAETAPANAAAAPMAMPSTALVPALAPAAAVAPAMVAPPAVPHPAAASAPNSSARPGAKASTAPARSSSARPRAPLKSASAAHRLSMQN